MFDDFDDEDDFFDAGDSADIATAEASLKPPRENPDVFGHDSIEQTLLSAFNEGHLPHALIFSGPKGIGKSTFAFRLTRFLLKHGQGDDNQDSLFGEPLPTEKPTNFYVAEDDPVFRRVASGGHADLLAVGRPMDEKKGVQKSSVDVDTVRKIAPFLRMTSSEGGWRVVIVDDAETMNRNAQNAILKILEEPPEKALLILVCHRLGAMIPTIRSRCRTFHFQPLDKGNLDALLKRGAPNLAADETTFLTDMAEGSIGRAMELQEEGALKTLGSVLDLLSNYPQWDWPQIHNMAETLGRFGSDNAYNSFVAVFDWMCASILLAAATGPDKLPKTLQNPAIKTLLTHYSLEQWIGICDKLKAHFTAIEVSNLDKRQGVIGAFAILGGQSI